jgi:NAD(P)-dependent dehydrogenase (short-subunit alcohol dehydrogenase family)
VPDVVLSPDAARLDGRLAVVTGAAAGIGRAGALGLAAYGADIVAVDRDEDGLDSLVGEVVALGRHCATVVGDVRQHETIAQLVEVARDAADGGVHVLVNNAGGGFASPFEAISPKGDETLLRENLLQVVWITRAFLPLLADGASIINVTTVEAHRAAPGFSVYAAAKAGVDNLCRTLALELGDRGIRVNAVAPDVIATPGVGDMADYETPLGRPGHADEVAGAVVFLAGDLSSYVTGSTVHVDGGTLAAAGWRRRPDGGWRP